MRTSKRVLKAAASRAFDRKPSALPTAAIAPTHCDVARQQRPQQFALRLLTALFATEALLIEAVSIPIILNFDFWAFMDSGANLTAQYLLDDRRYARGYGAQVQELLSPWAQAPVLAPLLVQAAGGLAGGSQSEQ